MKKRNLIAATVPVKLFNILSEGKFLASGELARRKLARRKFGASFQVQVSGVRVFFQSFFLTIKAEFKRAQNTTWYKDSFFAKNIFVPNSCTDFVRA